MKIDILPPDPAARRRAASRSSPSSTRSSRPRSPSRSTARSGSTRSAIPTSSKIRIQLEDKVLRAFIRRSQAYASNTHIFLVWMVGTSLVLLMIAIPFLRNQIRPILKLAEAAESFGKGRPMPPRLPAARRRGGAARRLRLHPDARAHRAPDRAAHRDADRRQPRSADHPHPLQAAAGAVRIEAPTSRRSNQRHRRHAVDARRLSGLRARRGCRGRRAASTSPAISRSSPRKRSCASAR